MCLKGVFAIISHFKTVMENMTHMLKWLQLKILMISNYVEELNSHTLLRGT